MDLREKTKRIPNKPLSFLGVSQVPLGLWNICSRVLFLLEFWGRKSLMLGNYAVSLLVAAFICV